MQQTHMLLQAMIKILGAVCKFYPCDDWKKTIVVALAHRKERKKLEVAVTAH